MLQYFVLSAAKMFLNRLRRAFLSINRVALSSVLENRFSQLPTPESNAVLFDMRRCENLWRRTKASDTFYNHVNYCFSKNEKSSTYLVNTMRLASANCDFPPELMFTFISAYNRYVEKNAAHCELNREQKLEILSFVLNYKNYQLLKLACDVFKISNEEKSCFQEFIRELLHQEKISEAAYCISVLNLQKDFPIEKIILQLLHENKWKPAIAFLKENPDFQLQTAKLLDSFVNKENNSGTISISSRQAYRALASIVKVFKIPTVECKNLHFVRSKGAINLLIRRRHQKSISEKTWLEMLMKIIGDDQGLKEHLLIKLMYYGDKETALEMKEMLKMHDFDLDAVTALPSLIKSLDAESDELETEDEMEKCGDENDNLTFNLSSSDIKFVVSRSCYLECIENISKNYNMVGIDTEWKPQFGLVQDRLALIQLAVHDKVYILDMLSLNKCLTAEDWDRLMDDVFSNPKIIKLGCNLMTDIQMIVENNRGSKGGSLRFTHILDMAIFFHKLQEVYPDEMGKEENSRNLIGLSQLCKLILGKPLNKEERLCDWEKRPLTDAQLEYAALDAYCLLQIFDGLKKLSSEKNMNFDHLVKVAMVMTSGHNKLKKKLKEGKKPREDMSKKSIAIEEFKVAVQPELEFISRSLIEMGANVLVLQPADKASDAALIAKTQRRLLICLDDFKMRVENISSDVKCYGVSCVNNDIRELYKILQKGNVRQDNQSYTCQSCNSVKITQLSSKDLVHLKELGSVKEDAHSENILNDNLLRTISDMKKAGVKLKFNNQDFLSTDSIFLCKKCGLVQ